MRPYVSRVLLLAGLLTTLLYCGGAFRSKPQYTTPRASMFGALSHAKYEAARAKAERGDGAAAYLLSRYFVVSRNKPMIGARWLKRSARLGDAEAQYALGMDYLLDPSLAIRTDPELAK